MLKDKTIGFIGGGQMAEAIFSGALAAGMLRPGQVLVADAVADRLDALGKTYGVQGLLNAADGAGARRLVAQSDVVVLCVKPQLMRAVLEPVAEAFRPGQTVISIIGGMPLAALEGLLPNSPVIRVMPNTPMLVRLGSAGIAPGAKATEADVAFCRTLFDAVGSSYLLPESQMDPLTAISGCGPAFVYLFIEALADGGVEQGLPRALAQQLAAETLAGAAQMVLQTGQHPAQLKDSVCSPGGGTIAGVHALEAGGFRAAVLEAVAKSRRRMQELGQ